MTQGIPAWMALLFNKPNSGSGSLVHVGLHVNATPYAFFHAAQKASLRSHPAIRYIFEP